MTDDASKKTILARRAKFVAAALAGISIAACKDGGPFVCLKVAAPHDAEAEDAQPMPCLSPPPIDSSRGYSPQTPDAGPPTSTATDASTEASGTDAAPAKDAGHALKPIEPRPHVCLTPLQPKKQQ